MKLLFTLLFLLSGSTKSEISEIRKIYTNAAKSETNAKLFADRLSSVSDTDENKILVAYKGCSLTLQSKFSGNLIDKIRYMKDGAGLIDHAAGTDPQNIEIRMIRLSVQESVPGIVNYRQDIETDKAFILAHYHEADPETKDFVVNFIRQSKSFSKAEKKAVK
jgi:hypothetical protein